MRKRWPIIAVTVVALGSLLGGGYWFWRSYRTFYVASGAMEPTLHVEDRVLCHKQHGEIERGQMVFFRPTAGGFVAPSGPPPALAPRPHPQLTIVWGDGWSL